MALPISKCQPTAGLLNSSTKRAARSEEHTSELQSQSNLVCRLLLEKKKKNNNHFSPHAPGHSSRDSSPVRAPFPLQHPPILMRSFQRSTRTVSALRSPPLTTAAPTL